MTAMATESAWDALEGVNLPGGYRVEITDGKIIMTPRGMSQWKVILSAAPQIKAQLAGRGDILSDVMVDFPSTLYGYAPDLAVVAPGAEHNKRGRTSGTTWRPSSRWSPSRTRTTTSPRSSACTPSAASPSTS